MIPRIRFRPWQKDILAGVALLVCILPLFQPLLRDTLPVTHDGHHHIYRLYALDLALRGGAVWPRWLPQMGFGYGFPVFNFYAPLIYYIGEWMHVLGVGVLNTFRLLIGLGFLLPAWAFYAFARHQLGRAGAFIGALFYTYATYRIGDAFIRAALPEHWAFLFPPLLLLTMWHIGQNRRSAWTIPGGAILAAFFLMHNLSVILFAPMLVVYGLGWILVDIQPNRTGVFASLSAVWVKLAVMALSGIGLAAFFLLPGAREVQYIHASTVTSGVQAYAELLQSHVGSLIRFPGAQSPPGPYAMTTMQFYLVLLGVIAALIVWPQMKRRQRAHFLFAGSMALFAIFMMLRLSQPLLPMLPQLAYLQFPWRWNALLTFSLAYLAGFSPMMGRLLPRPARQPAAVAVALLVVLLLSLWVIPHSFPETLQTMATTPMGEKPLEESDLRPGILGEYDFQTGLWLRRYGGAWLFEYLPVWAEGVREEWFLPDDSPPHYPPVPGVPQIQVLEQAALRQVLTVDHSQPFTMRWHTFFFPGWTVFVDGKPVRTYPDTEMGLVAAEIPAGQHQVILRFAQTPVRRVGAFLSLLTLALWGGGMVWKRQWPLLAGLGVSLAILVVPIQWHRTSASTIYSPHLPTEDWTIFEDRAQLLGYHVHGDPRPGSPIVITLQWQALRNVVENDHVFIAFVDAQGKSWGQVDSQPGFNFTPTTRWQPGELMEDTYILNLPPDLPPGTYQLRVGMYDPDTMQRRQTHNRAGETSDQIWLGELVVGE